MKKKNLEIILQKIPDFDKPSPLLEQYTTPGNIAADILFIAFQYKDIKDKEILDLGCGTGIFSVGAYLLGAKKVTGIDIDKTAVKIAKNYALEKNYDINYIHKDVKDVETTADTTIMNPPFGAQKQNKKGDRIFIEKGFQLSKIIYTIHLTETIPFLEKMIKSLNGKITLAKNYNFPIKHTYDFHKKRVVNYDVTLLRIDTNKRLNTKIL